MSDVDIPIPKLEKDRMLYKGKVGTIEHAGVETMGGRAVHVLNASMSDGVRSTYGVAFSAGDAPGKVHADVVYVPNGEYAFPDPIRRPHKSAIRNLIQRNKGMKLREMTLPHESSRHR